VIGIVGVFLAFFHNAPPVKLYSIAPGVGELASGIGCGPLVVVGSYYVQTQSFSWEAFWLSVTLGLLVMAILYINEFPDRVADGSVGKKTVPVVLGPKRAVWGYVGLIAAAYLVILGGVIMGSLPLISLLVLLALPLAWKGVRGALRHYADIPALIPAMAATIQLHVAVGLLLCLGYLVTILL
jgi:1,4-dihydroxy-2-naphthoate octaprenyltransferase